MNQVMLLSINFRPEITGIGKYNSELVEFLNEKGVSVDVITAPPYYPEWKIQEGYSKFFYKFEKKQFLNIVRCPIYVPKKVTSVSRLIHLVSFSITSSMYLFTRFFKKHKKTDLIIVLQPTLFTTPFILFFSKIKGIKTLLHIQDYEIEAFFNLNMFKLKFLQSFVYFIESYLMSKFDYVSTISHTMLQLARDKGVSDEKLIFFPNWSDVDFVKPITEKTKLKSYWGFKKEEKVILYSGNIGDKQGLEIVIEAANTLKKYDCYKFLIVGNGANLVNLQDMVANYKLKNITFLPLQSWELVPSLLNMADIHLVIQKRGAADFVLPSKLTNILACGGNAIVTTDADTELGRLSTLYPGIYECIEPENYLILAKKLESMLIQKKCGEVNYLARKYAVDYLSKNNIMERFIDFF